MSTGQSLISWCIWSCCSRPRISSTLFQNSVALLTCYHWWTSDLMYRSLTSLVLVRSCSMQRSVILKFCYLTTLGGDISGSSCSSRLPWSFRVLERSHLAHLPYCSSFLEVECQVNSQCLKGFRQFHCLMRRFLLLVNITTSFGHRTLSSRCGITNGGFALFIDRWSWMFLSVMHALLCYLMISFRSLWIEVLESM